jgi:hypothetical protein
MTAVTPGAPRGKHPPAGAAGVGGDASGEDVWRVDMTAVMARPEPARHVDPVWARRHGYEALSVSESKMHAGVRDTDDAMR